MPTITVNGVRLYYELHGPPGAEVLVLSNGVLMSTASWAYQTPVLSRHFRVLLYDCRGMWQSEHPPGPYSMDLHAEDLEALMNALGIKKAHIGGISYGAEVSMVFANEYPERTRSLVLSSAVSELGPRLQGITETWIAAVRNRDPEMFSNVTVPVNFSEAWIAANPAALAAARERYDALDWDALLELLLCFSQLDFTQQLGQIEVPTLVIVGEEDTLKPRRYAEILAVRYPVPSLPSSPMPGMRFCGNSPGSLIP